MRHLLMLSCSVLALTGAAHAADIALLPHVPDNATLSATKSTAYDYLVRDDFSIGLGAPPIPFKSLAGTCVANGLVNDGGSCVNAVGGGSWLAIFPPSGADPREWGCVGDGLATDTNCMQAAITAMAYSRLSIVGGKIYKTGSLTVSSPIKIVCENAHSKGGFRAATTNINLLTLSTGNVASVEDCFIDMKTAGTNTSGAAIILGSGQNFSMRNLIDGPFIGVDIEGGQNNITQGDDIFNIVTNGIGVRVGANTTLGGTVNPRIEGLFASKAVASTGNYGFYIYDAGGLKYSRNWLFQMGSIVKPGANQIVQWGFFEGELGDTAAGNVHTIDTGAASAIVEGLQYTQTWTGSASATGVSITNSGGGKVSGLHFLGHRSYNNGAYGFQVGNGTDAISDFTLDASSVCGNNASAGGFSGIEINSTNVKGSIRNSTIGNTCDGLTTGTQNFSIHFNVAASNWDISHNDLRTATDAAHTIGGTLPTVSKIEDNANYNPVGGLPLIPGASPWIYTAGPSPETVYLTGGTVSAVFMDGGNVCLASPCAVHLPPGDAVAITYSVVPTVRKVVE